LLKCSKIMSGKKLHITVAAAPNTETGNPKLLEHDLRLTKASILYADQVKLYSMTSWMATSFHLMTNFPISIAQKYEILMGFVPTIASLNPDSVDLFELQKMQLLLQKNKVLLTKKEKLKIARFNDFFPTLWNNMSESFNRILKGFGFDELELAANSGFLELQPFLTTGTQQNLEEFLSFIEEMLNSPTTHPMLDELISNLVKQALREGKMSVGSGITRRGKQIGLVADLFDRLPIFDVRMDELLDLREELQNPLIRFRAEMVNLSNDIESASWDEDFPADVQQTYQHKIAPALLEIEEKLQSTALKEFLTRRIVEKWEFAAGSVGAAVLGASISPLAGIGAAMLATGIFIKSGQSELKEKIQEIERNGLYFYYKVKNRIGK
jgi:hypothetical protein